MFNELRTTSYLPADFDYDLSGQEIRVDVSYIGITSEPGDASVVWKFHHN